MRKLCFALAGVSLLFWGLGCATPRSPIQGWLYTDVSDGLLANPGDVPDNCKVGMATATNIIGVTMGDSSIDAARKSAGIKKVHYVDYHSWGILGIYGNTTTKVYGE